MRPPTGSPAPPALELVRIDKRFGPVHANRGVSLAAARGSVHGVIGENGAGKSTLMNVAYGYHRPDSGEIRINGAPAAIRGPRDAIARGVGMVHQHFMLVDAFTVLENLALGAEGGFRLRAGLARARRVLAALADQHGLAVDPDAVVGDLPVGLRQRVEILKALHRGADILILDEPTGVLAPGEAEALFRILRGLRDRGKTVVLITHKLREVMALCDRVTVMRAGRAVACLDAADTDRESLAALMVGRAVSPRAPRAAAPPGRAVLEVERLRVRDRNGALRVRGVGFAVRAGEIVGVAGVAGNGQSELLDALAGLLPAEGGAIRIGGAPAPRGGSARAARTMRARGVACVPEDRLRAGLVAAFDACENAALGRHRGRRYGRGGWLSRRALLSGAARLMARFDVRPAAPASRTALFSGGNQQKIVVGRELGGAPALLLAGQPTRGVDIGAMAFIHRELAALRDAGAAILLVSVELEEIMALSDRILVMFDGEIVGETSGAGADERALGLMMAGGRAATPPPPG